MLPVATYAAPAPPASSTTTAPSAPFAPDATAGFSNTGIHVRRAASSTTSIAPVLPAKRKLSFDHLDDVLRPKPSCRSLSVADVINRSDTLSDTALLLPSSGWENGMARRNPGAVDEAGDSPPNRAAADDNAAMRTAIAAASAFKDRPPRDTEHMNIRKICRNPYCLL